MSTSPPSLVLNTPAVEAPLSESFITKCLELLASAVGRLDPPAPSELLHRAKDGTMYILPAFNIFAKAILWVLLFGQTHLNCNTVKNLAVVDSDVTEVEVLLQLIQDARSKIKMSAFSLGLVFTLMQIISSGSWSALSPFLYVSIMLVFVSIALHTVTSSCYEAILQNSEGAARWFLHVRAMTGTPFALDPWIALSIPSAWTFWSFFFFFVVTLMTAYEYSPSASVVSPTASVGADVLRASHVKGVTAVFVVLILGLKSCLLILITWRPYVINRG